MFLQQHLTDTLECRRVFSIHLMMECVQLDSQSLPLNQKAGELILNAELKWENQVSVRADNQLI